MTRSTALHSNLVQIAMAITITAVACLVPVGEADARQKKPSFDGQACQGAPTGDGFLDSGSHFQDYDYEGCIKTDYVCDSGTLCWTESRIKGCSSKYARLPAPRQCVYNPKPSQAILGDLGEFVVDGIAPPDEPLSPKEPSSLSPTLEPGLYY